MFILFSDQINGYNQSSIRRMYQNYQFKNRQQLNQIINISHCLDIIICKQKIRFECPLWVWDQMPMNQSDGLFFLNFMKRVQKEKDLFLSLAINKQDIEFCLIKEKYNELTQSWKIIQSIFDKLKDQAYSQIFKNCLIIANSYTEYEIFLQSQKFQQGLDKEKRIIQIIPIQIAISINCLASYYCKRRELKEIQQPRITYLRIERVITELLDKVIEKILFTGNYNKNHSQIISENTQYICISEITLKYVQKDIQKFQNSYQFMMDSQNINEMQNVNYYNVPESNSSQKLFDYILEAISKIKSFGSQLVVVSYTFDMENNFINQLFQYLISKLREVTQNNVIFISTSENFTYLNFIQSNTTKQNNFDTFLENTSNKLKNMAKTLNNEPDQYQDPPQKQENELKQYYIQQEQKQKQKEDNENSKGQTSISTNYTDSGTTSAIIRESLSNQEAQERQKQKEKIKESISSSNTTTNFSQSTNQGNQSIQASQEGQNSQSKSSSIFNSILNSQDKQQLIQQQAQKGQQQIINQGEQIQQEQKQKEDNQSSLGQTYTSTHHTETRTNQENTKEYLSIQEAQEIQKQKADINQSIGSSSSTAISYSQSTNKGNQSIQSSQEGQHSQFKSSILNSISNSQDKQQQIDLNKGQTTQQNNFDQDTNIVNKIKEENKLKQKQDDNIQISTSNTASSTNYTTNQGNIASEEQSINNQNVQDKSAVISEIQYMLSIHKSANFGKFIEMVKIKEKSSNIGQLIEKIELQQKHFYPCIDLQNQDAYYKIAQLPLRSSFVDIIKNYDSIQLFITVSEENYLGNKELKSFDPYSIYYLTLNFSKKKEDGERNEGEEFKKFEINNYKNKLIGRYITCDEEFVYLLNGFNYPDQNSKNNKKKFYNQCDKINIKDKSIEQISGCKPIGYELDNDVYIFTTKDNIFYAGVNKNENNICYEDEDGDDENNQILGDEPTNQMQPYSQAGQDEPTKSTYEPIQPTQESSFNSYQTISAYNPEKESIRIELNLKMQIYDKEYKIWHTVDTPMTDNKIFIFAAAKQKNQYYELIAKKKYQIKKYVIHLVTIQKKDKEEFKDDDIGNNDTQKTDKNFKISKERLGILKIELINHEFFLTNNNIPERVYISSFDPNYKIKEIKFLEKPYFKRIKEDV